MAECNNRYNVRVFQHTKGEDVREFVNKLMAARDERNVYDRERPTTTWLEAYGLLHCIVEWWDY
jgi:hypothetical protein